MSILSNLRGWARNVGLTRKGGGFTGPMPPQGRSGFRLQPLIAPEVFRAPAGRVAEELYPEAVRELRQIDPQAVLLYAGRGWWMLGALWPYNHVLDLVAQRIQRNLRTEEIMWDSFKEEWCRAVRVGFRSIELYTEKQVAEGFCARDFRLRDWNYRTTTESVQRQAFDLNVDDELERLQADLAHMHDKLHSDVRSIDRYVFRHAKGFHQRRAFPGALASLRN